MGQVAIFDHNPSHKWDKWRFLTSVSENRHMLILYRGDSASVAVSGTWAWLTDLIPGILRLNIILIVRSRGVAGTVSRSYQCSLAQ